jgi:hypothetical protein
LANSGLSKLVLAGSAWYRSMRSTSRFEPNTTPMRWCSDAACLPSLGARPLLARPPACSIRNPIGSASCSERRRPGVDGSLVSRGYVKTAPRMRVKTCLPMTSSGLWIWPWTLTAPPSSQPGWVGMLPDLPKPTARAIALHASAPSGISALKSPPAPGKRRPCSIRRCVSADRWDKGIVVVRVVGSIQAAPGRSQAG